MPVLYLRILLHSREARDWPHLLRRMMVDKVGMVDLSDFMGLIMKR
jgi:hypothetical protein